MDIKQVSSRLISREMEQAVQEGVFPGGVLLCSKDSRIVFHKAFGRADLVEGIKTQTSTIFDLASLTKPLATALAAVLIVKNGAISLNAQIGSVIHQFKGTDKEKITVDMLLRHTSGLPAYKEYFRQIADFNGNPREKLRGLIVREDLENRPGECQVYSDLGFILLAWIIEEVTGLRLDRFVHEKIYQPLTIKNLFFIELDRVTKTAVNIGAGDKKMYAAAGRCPWRKKLIKAEVDDDNAWAAGGIEGHAGLFGDALSVYRVCLEILHTLHGKPDTIFDPKTLRSFVEKKNGFEMVAGFDTPAKKESSAGRYFSKSSIGHLGFTGTSFWIDPETSLMAVLLTNRVHPLRESEGIRPFRRKIHDLIYKTFA